MWKVGGLVLLALAGCAPIPIGPTVPVMPAPYKPMDVFVAEDRACREWASAALAGVAGGADSGYQSGYDAQGRYDIAYLQCMYSKGNQLPGAYPSQDGTGPSPVPPPPAGVQPAPAQR